MKNAPCPALIYHMPEQGTCIAVVEYDDLIEWHELPQNPVRPHRENDEYVVFDLAGWYEKGALRDTTDHDSRVPGSTAGQHHRGDAPILNGRRINDREETLSAVVI